MHTCTHTHTITQLNRWSKHTETSIRSSDLRTRGGGIPCGKWGLCHVIHLQRLLHHSRAGHRVVTISVRTCRIPPQSSSFIQGRSGSGFIREWWVEPCIGGGMRWTPARKGCSLCERDAVCVVVDAHIVPRQVEHSTFKDRVTRMSVTHPCCNVRMCTDVGGKRRVGSRYGETIPNRSHLSTWSGW